MAQTTQNASFGPVFFSRYPFPTMPALLSSFFVAVGAAAAAVAVAVTVVVVVVL